MRAGVLRAQSNDRRNSTDSGEGVVRAAHLIAVHDEQQMWARPIERLLLSALGGLLCRCETSYYCLCKVR